jgi:hypothetical protein
LISCATYYRLLTKGSRISWSLKWNRSTAQERVHMVGVDYTFLRYNIQAQMQLSISFVGQCSVLQRKWVLWPLSSVLCREIA